MDINLGKFKEDAVNEIILIMGNIMGTFVFRKTRYKESQYNKIFYNVIKEKIKEMGHIYDVQQLDDTILFTVKAIDLHYIAEIEPFGNTYDIIRHYVVNPKTGEVIDSD